LPSFGVVDVWLRLLVCGLGAAWETDGTEYEEGGCAGGEKRSGGSEGMVTSGETRE